MTPTNRHTPRCSSTSPTSGLTCNQLPSFSVLLVFINFSILKDSLPFQKNQTVSRHTPVLGSCIPCPNSSSKGSPPLTSSPVKRKRLKWRALRAPKCYLSMRATKSVPFRRNAPILVLLYGFPTVYHELPVPDSYSS
jgi:hypothetical protein